MKKELEQVGENHDDSDAEHYEALCHLPKWQWLSRDGITVDLRRKIYIKSMAWAINILSWMEKHHTENTPYMRTDQYKYIEYHIWRIKTISAAAFKRENK